MKKSLTHFLSSLCLLFLLVTNFLFATASEISSFSPTHRGIRRLFSIDGIDLSTPTVLSNGGTSAIVILNSGTSLAALVMLVATIGTIGFTANGGSFTNSNHFTITAKGTGNLLFNKALLKSK